MMEGLLQREDMQRMAHLSRRLLQVFDDQVQLHRTAEECSEVAVEALHYARRDYADATGFVARAERLAEEIADALITLNTAAQIVGLDLVRRHLLAKLHRTEALCRMQPPPYIYASADKIEELPEGQSYYGHRFVATVQGVVGCGPTPADAVNRALANRSYRRDPTEWLAARRKRREAR